MRLTGSLEGEHRKELWETNRVGLALSVLITFASSVVGIVLTGWAGMIVGLICGVVSLFITTRTKVREVLRFRS